MVSRLGFDTDADLELLRHALEVTESYKRMLDGLRWPAREGSELARLDSLIQSNITLTDTFVVSQRTAVGCVLHLAEMFREGREPRSRSRSRASALVSSGHILYVLRPSDPDVRLEHARQMLRRQAGSHVAAIRAFTDFDQLVGRRAPTDLLPALESSRREIGGVTKPEGSMVLDIADSMAEALVDAGYKDRGEVGMLREHLAWMWHVWSGVAHGWAWPKYIPGLDDEEHDVAPGHWATDYFQLTSLVQQAVQLLVECLA